MSPLSQLLPIAAIAAAAHTDDEAHNLRVQKCELLVTAFYDHKDETAFLPYCETLVDVHEEIADEGVRKLQLAMTTDDRSKVSKYAHSAGYAGQWYYSLVYGAANFELRCHRRAPDNCYGPMDVKHYPLVTDPTRNIRWHCEEMWQGWLKGYRKRGLCEYVMYPARPHDWDKRGDGNNIGQFREVDQVFQARIRLAYQKGEL